MHIERSLAESPPTLLKRFAPDGVITRSETAEMATAIDRLKVPTVDLRGAHPPGGGITLDTDPASCSRLAIDHFIDRGFRHLAFCGYPGVGFSDQRCHAFVEGVAARGLCAEVFVPSRRSPGTRDTVARETDAEFSEYGLDKWIRGLPRPLAVFACNDVRARQVLASCGRTDLSVPDDVAVLGVDNDEVICDLSFPPLSSVVPNTWKIGYEGASLLDQLMSGNPIVERRVLVAPERIQVRRSSDVVAVEDPDVAAALRHIRDHACEGISVGDVARSLPISRTTLDRRFLSILKRSPKNEIDRVRIQRAKRLLELTDYKVSAIAEMTGYASAPQFVTTFKRLTGVTPGEHRNRVTFPRSNSVPS
jgi:LacI family transcriptional regulator